MKIKVKITPDSKRVLTLAEMPVVKEMTAEDMRDTVKMVSRWRIGKPADIVMNPVVDDGFLIINGDPVGRIAPKMPQPAFSEEAYYWEGKCLAMSEEYD